MGIQSAIATQEAKEMASRRAPPLVRVLYTCRAYAQPLLCADTGLLGRDR